MVPSTSLLSSVLLRQRLNSLKLRGGENALFEKVFVCSDIIGTEATWLELFGQLKIILSYSYSACEGECNHFKISLIINYLTF